MMHTHTHVETFGSKRAPNEEEKEEEERWGAERKREGEESML